MGDIAAFVARRRIGGVAGLAAAVTASALYRSDQHRTVLGRYSPLFAAWLGLISALLMGAIIRSITARRRPDSDIRLAFLLESAWFCLGAAYLASTLNDGDYGARALNGNLFGSPFVSSALLEYAAMCLLVAAGILLAARYAGGRRGNMILLVSSLCIVTLFGEGVARAVAFLGAQTHGMPSYSGEIFGRRFVRLNRAGFRDTEHALVATPGTRRLLLVGDSYAFGAGVREPADRFGEQLQATLREMSGQPWEVINHSLGDRNTLDEIRFLRQGLVYHPDAVLLLYVFNDADYLAGEASGARSITPRSSIFEHPWSIIDRLEPARVLYWNSFLFQELYARWRLLRYRFDRQREAWAATDVYHSPSLLSRHLADVADFVRIADSAGAFAAIVPLDPGVASEASLRDRYRTFTNAALHVGLPVWSVMGMYEGRDLREITVNSLDTHMNALGYHLAVEAVAPKVLAAMEQRPPIH